jgi:putative oxidoreductase
MTFKERVGETWLNRLLWAAQIILAALYFSVGALKLTVPPTALVEMGMGFATAFPQGFVHFIGWAEVLGAIGLVLPAATRILPGLTVLAALGLSLIQVLAMGYHVLRGELPILAVNLALLGISSLILWGRMIEVPILSRFRRTG